jgi:hypothetical protein
MFQRVQLALPRTDHQGSVFWGLCEAALGCVLSAQYMLVSVDQQQLVLMTMQRVTASRVA